MIDYIFHDKMQSFNGVIKKLSDELLRNPRYVLSLHILFFEVLHLQVRSRVEMQKSLVLVQMKTQNGTRLYSQLQFTPKT